jgi:aspartate/methionine/tyrosine aminotransferase
MNQSTEVTSTSLDNWYSQDGKGFFFPKGIIYWTGRAKKEAKLNGTVGSALVESHLLYPGEGDDLQLAHLPDLLGEYTNLSATQAFAYAPVLGVPAFRNNWKKWLLYKAGELSEELSGHITDPIVVPGITGAISLVSRLLLNPGDTVVLPDKYWGNYNATFKMNYKMGLRTFPTFANGEFNLDGFIETCASEIKRCGKASAVINFPNNPTGYVPPKGFAEEFTSRVKQLVASSGGKLLLMFDDAYEGFVYDDDRDPQSLFYSCANLGPQILSVKMDGVSKELFAYGARLGAVTIGLCDEWLEKDSWENLNWQFGDKMGGILRSSLSNCTHAGQEIFAAYLEDPSKLVQARKSIVDDLAERHACFRKALEMLPTDCTSIDPFQGGFFALINLKDVDGLALAEKLMTEYALGVVPHIYKEGNVNGIRVAFCGLKKSDMEKACGMICQALESMR